MTGVVTNGRGLPNDLSEVVDPESTTVRPSEGSQVSHTPGFCPQKGMASEVANGRGLPNDLSAVIDSRTPARGSSQRPQVCNRVNLCRSEWNRQQNQQYIKS